MPPLAESAKHLYVFQRTPSAIGERGNRPTDPDFAQGLEPGWQRARMDNFQAIMLGRPVEADLVDDGWTHHYAAVQHPPRTKGMTMAEYMRSAEELDYGIMEAHRRRVEELVADPATAEILKPYYRYLCKRPCFHDEYLPAFNNPNVTLVDCPAGIERITEQGPVVDGKQYEVDCIIYGTGFEAELTPLYRRAGHEIVGRGGVTLAEKWADGAASLFGMMSRGFPNMFVMPAPGQQAVVTVNYTQLAVLGAEFIGGAVGLLEERGVEVFDVSAEAEEAWTQKIVDSFVDGSAVMSACTPSRINNEGHPEAHEPPQRQLRPGDGRLVRLPRAARAVARGRQLRGPGARGPVDGVVSARQRVAVVTGGGGGIGAAIAEELGRGGWFVVTVDPLVTLDGSEQLPEPEETTAGRIVAAGGSARASSVSVTDGEAVRGLFQELVDEHGGLDAVVNVAGITRQTYFGRGHRGGLAGGAGRAPRGLPQRARRRAAAHGRRRARPRPRRHLRIGVAGRRCRRLQLRQAGRRRPHLAAGPAGAAGRDRQRHVAHRRHPDGGRRPRAGPEGGPVGRWRDLLPLDGRAPRTSGRSAPTWSATDSGGAAAGCSSPAARRWRSSTSPASSRWCAATRWSPWPGCSRRSSPAPSPRPRPARRATAAATPGSGRSSTSRPPPSSHRRRCGPAPSSPTARGWPRRSTAALEARSITCHRVEVAHGFGDAANALSSVVEAAGPIDAVVVAPAGGQPTATSTDGWERVLAEHRGIVEHIHTDAGWARAAADYAAGADRPVQLVTLTDAATAGGRSRAQASAQHARVAAGATEGRVTAFAVSIEASEADGRPAGR